MACSSRYSPGQTTHCWNHRPEVSIAHATPTTSTRIQTHQNLFTLTKNISLPTIRLGTNIQLPPMPTFAGTTSNENRNSISPYKHYVGQQGFALHPPRASPLDPIGAVAPEARRSNEAAALRADGPRPHDSSLVEMDGIEPTTPCLQSRCSTN